MTETNFEQIVEASLRDEAQAQGRIGKSGSWWCFACGHESDGLAHCGRSFPREFSCVGLKNLCAPCRAAHQKVGVHLTQLFSEKRLSVFRVDSRRSRLFRFLRDALEALSEKGNAQAQALRFLLGAHCDPRADENADFRKGVLDCFSRVRLLDFRALAEQLDREEKAYYIERIVCSGIFGRPTL